MMIEWIGVNLALMSVGTIAFGHVLVRRLHARFGTRPAVPLLVLGALIIAASTQISSNSASAVLGIIGVTTLWDGIEVVRQEERSRRDHETTPNNR